jgi:hypothetical protein
VSGKRPFRKTKALGSGHPNWTPEQASQYGRRGGKVSAAQRRERNAARSPYAGTVLDLMDATGQLRPAARMTGPAWSAWRVFLKAIYGLGPLTDEELAIYQRHTGRTTPPSGPVSEAFMIVGRSGGKSRVAALNAVHRAISFDPSTVAEGEPVTIPLFARSKDQTRQMLGYVRGLNALPEVAPYVHRGTLKTSLEYTTGVTIEIMSASFRTSRGYTCPIACCDEVAFWQDEASSNPAAEILTALRGTLVRVKRGLLLVLSSPYAPNGALYEAHQRYYGVDDPDVLVWVSDTASMNPTVDQATIEREFRRDPQKAMSEFGSDGTVSFRQHERSPFELEKVDAVVVAKRYRLPPVSGVKYAAFLDVAQGQGSRSGSWMALAIAHEEGSRAVLDLVEGVEPPFDPARVLVDRFVPLLRNYRCRQVMGDRVSHGFVSALLAAEGIKFVSSELDKSALFAELLLLVNSGVVELLDDATLRNQLTALQRRPTRGKDSFDVPRGWHDDVANSAAGALTIVTGVGVERKKPLAFSGSSPQGRTDPHAAMLALIKSTKERLEAQDRRDREIERAFENEPMISEPVWFVHKPRD